MKVFITKDRPWKFLNSIERTGKAVFVYRSCISLNVIEEQEPPATDWIFFSSPSGVRLFFGRFAPNEDTRIAVLGEGTASALEETDYQAAFVPDTPDVISSIKAFVCEVNDTETVLYPRSTESLLRLHDVLMPPQLVDWPFYTTSPNPPGHPVYDDYLVFTSPSNAKAYLQSQRIRSGQRIVAIGHSTAAAIMEKGITGFLVSEAPSPEAIWKCIADDAGIPS